MTTTIRSNRDLYRVVTETLAKRERPGPSLEVYLARLRTRLLAHADSRMTADALASALDKAFEGPDPAPNSADLERIADEDQAPGWHRQLARQILDLREMAEAGTLEDDQRYYGVDAPSGARWYNFDPHSFVECGLCGSFGGWEPDADSDRQHVPGEVLAIDEDGKAVSVEPETLQKPPRPLDTIDWDDIESFLWAGQHYE
jgi:hypothetical protein